MYRQLDLGALADLQVDDDYDRDSTNPARRVFRLLSRPDGLLTNETIDNLAHTHGSSVT